jgi:hypothetical protein
MLRIRSWLSHAWVDPPDGFFRQQGVGEIGVNETVMVAGDEMPGLLETRNDALVLRDLAQAGGIQHISGDQDKVEVIDAVEQPDSLREKIDRQRADCAE